MNGGVAEHDLAEVYPDAKSDLFVFGIPNRVVAKLPLDLDGKLQCPGCAVENAQNAVSGNVDYFAAVVANQGLVEADGALDPAKSRFLAPAHQLAVAVDIGKQNRQ